MKYVMFVLTKLEVIIESPSIDVPCVAGLSISDILSSPDIRDLQVSLLEVHGSWVQQQVCNTESVVYTVICTFFE